MSGAHLQQHVHQHDALGLEADVMHGAAARVELRRDQLEARRVESSELRHTRISSSTRRTASTASASFGRGARSGGEAFGGAGRAPCRGNSRGGPDDHPGAGGEVASPESIRMKLPVVAVAARSGSNTSGRAVVIVDRADLVQRRARGRLRR